MALHCHVSMEHQGIEGQDDGVRVWHKTDMQLVVAGRVLRAALLVNGYSGERRLRLVHDEIGLDRPEATTLLEQVYDACSSNMHEAHCEIGQAFLDLQALIEGSFYRSQAQTILRRIRSDK